MYLDVGSNKIVIHHLSLLQSKLGLYTLSNLLSKLQKEVLTVFRELCSYKPRDFRVRQVFLKRVSTVGHATTLKQLRMALEAGT